MSDNGSNIKAAWDDEDNWSGCACHTLELATIPFTHYEKNRQASLLGNPSVIGSVKDSYVKARGLVGYLHFSVTGMHDFHKSQKNVGLPPRKLDQVGAMLP